jgi:hypothetical protein
MQAQARDQGRHLGGRHPMVEWAAIPSIAWFLRVNAKLDRSQRIS